jgi:hypothetical protein
MAKSLTAANKQIDRLKAKLQQMKVAAMTPKAPKVTLASVKRRKNVQARINAAQAVIADLTKKIAKGGKAATIAKMEERVEKLQAMIASLQKSAKKLTVYNVRLMLNESQVGEFGPYATIRAASADAKNILRMHLGPDNKIEEIGVDEPLLRSDGKIMAYFHPSIYTGQQSGGGILTAQVVETGGASERTATFVSSVKKPKKKKKAAADEDEGGAQTSLLNPRRHYLAVLQDNGGGGAWRFKHEVGVFASLVAAKRKASTEAADYADAQRGGWKYRVAIYPADASGRFPGNRAVAVVNTAATRTNRRRATRR